MRGKQTSSQFSFRELGFGFLIGSSDRFQIAGQLVAQIAISAREGVVPGLGKGLVFTRQVIAPVCSSACFSSGSLQKVPGAASSLRRSQYY
jgi:hypothetical protein